MGQIVVPLSTQLDMLNFFLGSSGGEDVLPGTIILFGGSGVPTGYLLCDGSAVNRTTYADLFTAIGVTWGAGNGTTTFNVPDCRSKMPLGAGAGPGYTPRTLGGTGGIENATIGGSNLPSTFQVSEAGDSAPGSGPGFCAGNGSADQLQLVSNNNSPNGGLGIVNPFFVPVYLVKT